MLTYTNNHTVGRESFFAIQQINVVFWLQSVCDYEIPVFISIYIALYQYTLMASER